MSELNKILGRDFIIAFLLPALFFLVANFLSFEAVSIPHPWLKFNPEKPLEDTTILGLEAFVFGVFLQSVNRELFRLAEGYWEDYCGETMTRCLGYFQKRRFRKLKQDLATLRAERGLCQREARPFATKAKYNKLSEGEATRFPRREDLVLPTTFGNVVRAYEDYPRAVYNFESINGWSRIQALMSKQVAELLSRTRARVDMWLNFGFVTSLLMAEIAVLGWKFRKVPFWWLFGAGLLFIVFAYTRARSSAARYGEQVKAAFDIYLPQLAQKLGFVLSQEVEKNRAFWQAYSRLMVYRDPDALEEMSAAGLKLASCGRSKPNNAVAGHDDNDE